MKTIIFTLALCITVQSMATSTQGIICRDDKRLEDGALRELILSPTENGYLVQSQFVPSLHSPDITIEDWADTLNCRIDERSALAYCINQQGQNVVLFKERREVFYDSLEENTKKKYNKHTDISIFENGVEKKTMSFAASHCQTFGDKA